MRVGLDGIVRLAGVAKRLTGTPVLETIFTLPAGSRPAVRVVFAVASGDGGVSTSYGRVDVLATGEVTWVGGASAAGAWVSLSTISFRAAG
jgi:hypothetical protein